VTHTTPAAKFIPERFRFCSLETFDPGRSGSSRVALEAARAYVDAWPAQVKTGAGMVLSGPAGTGKTHLSVGILRGLAGAWSAFVDAKLLLSSLRAGMDGQETDGAWCLQAAKRRRLLVLDDLAADDAKPSEWVVDTLGDVIRTRYNRKLPTIITTNRKQDTLERYLGSPLSSRIHEMCLWVLLVSKDARRKQ